MNNDEVKKLYSALIGKGYSTDDLGDEKTFRSMMADKANRKELYDWVSANGDFRIGDYDKYESRLTALQPIDWVNPDSIKPTITPNPEVLNYETPMTEAAKQDFRNKSSQSISNAQGIVDDANGRIDNMLKFGIQTGSPVKKDSPRYNLSTGKIEDTYITPSGDRYRDKNMAHFDTYVPDRQQEYVDGFGKSLKQSWEGLKEGAKFFTGEAANLFTGSSLDDKSALETLDRLQTEGNMGLLEGKGDTYVADKKMRTDLALIRNAIQEAGGDMNKARRIISERASDKSWGDTVMESAQEGMDKIKPTKGFSAWVGNMIPQMLPSAAAIALSFVTKNPKYAQLVGGIGMGGMTASTAGQSMMEARKAGATNGETWAVGITDGIIEYATEQLPFDNYTKRLFNGVKKDTGKKLAEAVSNSSSPAHAELQQLLTKANKKLGGKLFSGKNAKDYLANMAAEAGSEFTAEALQTITPMIYEDEENYPTLKEILNNGFEGAKAGLFMGSILGGASKIAEHRQQRARRKEQGFVDVAQVRFGKTDDVVEVVGHDEATGDYQVLRDGKVESVKSNDVLESHRFSFDEFDNAEIEMEADESYENGYSLNQQQDMTDAKNAYEYHSARLAESLGVDVESLEEEVGDPINFIKQQRMLGASDEDMRMIVDYANAKSAFNGMEQRHQDDIDSQISMSNEMIDARTNRNDGMIHPAVMQFNDRQVHIIDGNVVMTDDGTMADSQLSDATILIRDAETGKIEFTSPSDILSVSPALNADEEKMAAEQRIMQQLTQEYEDKTSGRVTAWNAGDAYTLTDEDGNQQSVTVVANEQGLTDNGDGTINIAGEDGMPVAMPIDVVQQMIDNTNKARVAAPTVESEESAPMEEPTESVVPGNANAVEGAPESYNADDELLIRDDDGMEKRAIVIGPVKYDAASKGFVRDEGGQIIEYFVEGEDDVRHDNIADLSNKVAAYIPFTAEAESAPENAESVPESAESVPENKESVESAPESTPAEPAPIVQADNGIVMVDGKPDFVASGIEKSLAYMRDVIRDDQRVAHKIAVTSEHYNKELGKAQKELKKAQDAYDNAPFGLEAKEEAALIKAQEKFNRASDESEFWNEMKLAVTPEVVAEEKPAEEPVVETPVVQPAEEPQPAIEETVEEATTEEPTIEEVAEEVQPQPEESAVEESTEETPVVEEVQPSTVQEQVEVAEAETNTNPSEAQKESGNYKKGHVKVAGFDVSIEQPKGSIRSGVDRNGKKWETEMKNTYGYFRGTEGVDGDHIDVFLSDDMDAWDNANVFVVDQYNEDGTFDEHKVMLGFNSKNDAEAAYFANYDSGWADSHKTVVTPVSLEEFKKWVDSSHRKTKAFAEYKNVKVAKGPVVKDGTMFKNNEAGGDAVAVVVGSETKDGERHYMISFAPDVESAEAKLFFGDKWVGESKLKQWLNEGKLTPIESKDEQRISAREEDSKNKVSTPADMRKLVDTVCGKLGLNVEWHDTLEENGRFDPETNTIHIAMDAENPLQHVFGHEATHAIKSISNEAYDGVKDAVKNMLDESWDVLVAGKKRLYESHGYKNYPLDYYEEEVVCDAVGRMLSDEYFAQSLCREIDNPSILGQIRNVIDKIVNAIMDAFGAVSDEYKAAENLKEILAEAIKSSSKKVAENAVNGEVEAGKKKEPSRLSIRANTSGVGLEIIKDDGNGNVVFKASDGTIFNTENPVTAEFVRNADETPFGYMLKHALSVGTVDEDKAMMLCEKYANILNAYIEKGSAENGGIEALVTDWLWQGETVYKTVAINSDAQYSFSLDITRVCKKNEAVIRAISEMQKRVGYGITPGQIMEIYMETDRMGYQVPCPVCYVFSRYIRNGKYATIMINGQRKYGKHLVDPSTLSDKERKKYIEFWKKELKKAVTYNVEHAKEITEANKVITETLDEIDALSKKATSKLISEAERKEAIAKVNALDKQYRAALNVVSQSSLDSWIKVFVLKSGGVSDAETAKKIKEEVKAKKAKAKEAKAKAKKAKKAKKKKNEDLLEEEIEIIEDYENVNLDEALAKIDNTNWDLYEDSYQGFPEEMALDLRQTPTVLRLYPAIQRYRNSRGAAAGKEIAFEADNAIGDVVLALGSASATKGLATPRDMSDEEWEKQKKEEDGELRGGTENSYVQASKMKPGKKKSDLLKNARKRFKAAAIYAQQQSLRGGQRMWSWSDNIERLAPDVAMNLLQLELLGGALQSYSKQLEGVKMVASCNGYVNGSLMGRGNGTSEVSAEEVESIDGLHYVKGRDYEVQIREKDKPKYPDAYEKDGRWYITAHTPAYFNKADGKWYTLEFDNKVGIEAFTHISQKDGKLKKGLFDLNNTLDRAGNILVGMNDIHVRTAMADPRVHFIIPWHSSGANNHILAQMYNVLKVDYKKEDSQDYTMVQEEKKLDSTAKSPTAINDVMAEYYEDHYNNPREYAGKMIAGKDFKCGIKGGIESRGENGDLSDGQKLYRELRDAVLLGARVIVGRNKSGNKYKTFDISEVDTEKYPKYKGWYEMIKKDEFLSQAHRKIRETVTLAGIMTSGDTKFMYPYEYWDENSTYETADVNTARYIEYCRRLGRKPKFCGKMDGKPEKDFGNFLDDKGAWKLLIDRRMYDVDGRFQDLTPIDMSGFNTDLVDPQKTKEEFDVTEVADKERTSDIIDSVIELEEGRPGGRLDVDYDIDLPKAVKQYRKAKEARYSLRENERESIIKEAKDNGVYLEAPYSNDPSNLNEEQWVNVRTQAFKDWFGDWEDDPDNASKVLDENFEPRVVYHATDNNFNVFDREKLGENTPAYATDRETEMSALLGFWFNDKIAYDLERAIPCFLNFRKPLSYDSLSDLISTLEGYESVDDYLEEVKRDGYDSLIVEYDDELGDTSYIALSPNQIKSADENDGTYSRYDDDIRYSIRERQSEDKNSYREVGESELLSQLREASDNGDVVKVYRTMQVIDGKLYSPMAKKVAGKETSEIKFRWEAAEEHPELAKQGDGSKGKPNKDSFYITIDKGQGKGSLTVAYNPYTHTSRTVLNDQFSSAYIRPNLVVVEVEVPKSELEGLYKAEKAKDSVGEMAWHSGAVSGKLAELGNPRKVILTRYDKPVRILTKKEEAEMIAKQLEGTGIAMPYNLVTPQVREELEKLGVEIDSKPSGGVSEDADYGKAQYVTDEQIEEMNRKLRENAVSDPANIRAAAERLAEELHTPVELIDDINSIVHEDEAKQKRMRRAKGWYDRRTGKICVVVPNQIDIEDAASTVFHEVVAHKGLRELVGEDNYDEFLKQVYEHVKTDVRKKINEKAAKHGWDFYKATDEYLGELAEKGFEDFSVHEQGVWEWLKEKVLKVIDKFLTTMVLPKSVKLGDNELRYLLWRSHKNLKGGKGSIFDRAEDIAKRAELGLDTDSLIFRDSAGETDDIWNDKSLGLRERMTSAAARLAKNHSSDVALRQDAMKAIGANLSHLRKAMNLQKRFDRSTVKRVSDLARILMNYGYLSGLGQMEVKRLLAVVRNSVGHDDVDASMRKIMDIMIDNQLKNAEGTLHQLMRIKASKVDAKGVQVQGKLDVDGQILIRAIKKGMGMQSTDIEEAIADAMDRMSSNSTSVAEEAAIEQEGLNIALEYVKDITGSKTEEKSLRDEMKNAIAEADEKDKSAESFKQYLEMVDESIRQNKVDRVLSYSSLIHKISEGLKGSIANASAFRELEKMRVSEIHHEANSDMYGRKDDAHRKDSWKDKFVNNSFVSFVFAPLLTFDQILRTFGRSSANGEGYLWNRFMRGWVDAREKEISGVRKKYAELDKKVHSIFGATAKTMGEAIRLESRLGKVPVSFWNGGKKQNHELTQGNLMYMYMVDKMVDGRMKLRKMGISEEDMIEVEKVLDPRYKELADWIQDEFLVETRNEYNETHKRMFGASMSAIENYFPLKILANARVDKADDLDNPYKSEGISTVTGSIIKRRRNALALDITGADALGVVMEHVSQMEHWNAYAEWNRDLNTLRTYKRFRNQVQNMTTVYGGGKVLWKRFNDVCQMASGSYRPPRASLDESAVNFAKGVSAAKVSFRLFTALKQVLSMPAYLPEASVKHLAVDMLTPWVAWKWCMDNLPVFKERLDSRTSGDPRLLKSEMDWKLWRSRVMEIASRIGMSPNAFVDALTVGIGAHSIYKTKLERYIKDGYEEEQAERMAKQDATILFNQTQQSSEGVFMSPMQVDRSWLSVMFSVFRNSSMAYTRQLYDAMRNLKRNIVGKEDALNFMAKQFEREGIEEEAAKRASSRKYNRQLVKDVARVAVFGYIMQLAWNMGAYLPYLLIGDDDDEKDKMWDDIWTHTMFGSIEGLTGGDVLSQAGAMAMSGEGSTMNLNKEMPLTADMMSIVHKIGLGKHMEGLSDIINLVVQSAVGVNPQSITDSVLAIMDACGDDPRLAHEASIFVARILQVPQSQIEELYFDEVGLRGNEVSKYTPAQLCKRYAQYKVKRGQMSAPFDLANADDSTWMMHAKSSVNERIEGLGDSKVNETYVKIEESLKPMKELYSSFRKAKEDNDALEAERMMNRMKEDKSEYRRFMMFRKLDSHLSDIVDYYLESDSPKLASLCKEAIIDYKAGMVSAMQAEDEKTRSERIDELGRMMKAFADKYKQMR